MSIMCSLQAAHMISKGQRQPDQPQAHRLTRFIPSLSSPAIAAVHRRHQRCGPTTSSPCIRIRRSSSNRPREHE